VIGLATASTSVVVGADGKATATIKPNAVHKWSVSQVSVELPGAPVGATCAIRRNGLLVTPVIPTGDVASGEPPVEIGPGDRLTVEWAGCTPGQTGSVLVIYDVTR